MHPRLTLGHTVPSSFTQNLGVMLELGALAARTPEQLIGQSQTAHTNQCPYVSIYCPLGWVLWDSGLHHTSASPASCYLMLGGGSRWLRCLGPAHTWVAGSWLWSGSLTVTPRPLEVGHFYAAWKASIPLLTKLTHFTTFI